MKFTTATILSSILSTAVAFSPNSLATNSVASRNGSNGMMRPMVASQDIEANAAPANGQRKRTKEVSLLFHTCNMHRCNCATFKICIASMRLVLFLSCHPAHTLRCLSSTNQSYRSVFNWHRRDSRYTLLVSPSTTHQLTSVKNLLSLKPCGTKHPVIFALLVLFPRLLSFPPVIVLKYILQLLALGRRWRE